MRANYNHIKMKKLVYLLAAGSMAFVACQNSPSYKVTGSVEDITDGDTIYLQEYAGGDLVKLDSAIVKSGTFVFTGKQDTAVNRYITYMKGNKRYFTDLFLENGNINVTLGKESKVSGTPNNDAYQKFKDGFMALSKEMNEMYQKAQSDTSLTEEQVEAIMAEIEKKWYVLRAISGKEAKVKEYLEADLKNSDLGEYVSQVLIPTEKVYQVRNGKKIVKERSYLPGYVLVEAALVGEVAHHLRNTPNVIGFLGGSEKPVPLRQSEVNRILGTVDELQETGEELNIPYVVGETVKVTFGPFSGFSGIIEEVNSEKKKLKVMVKIFGRKTPLELGFMQVEKE